MDLSEHLRTHATHAGPPTADSPSSTLPASAPRSRCHLACAARLPGSHGVHAAPAGGGEPACGRDRGGSRMAVPNRAVRLLGGRRFRTPLVIHLLLAESVCRISAAGAPS